MRYGYTTETLKEIISSSSIITNFTLSLIQSLHSLTNLSQPAENLGFEDVETTRTFHLRRFALRMTLLTSSHCRFLGAIQGGMY